MKKIEFENLYQAVQYAKQNGGWIFFNNSITDHKVIWYNALHYNRTKIMYDCKGSGRIDTWSYFEKLLSA